MKRAIVTPALLPAAALAELKEWLGITTSRDDAALSALLHGAIELCEDFTGIMPLEQDCEEILTASPDWQALSTRPVQAITGLLGIPAEGARFALDPSGYEIDLDVDGGGHVRVLNQGAAGRVAVRFTAGLAGTWDSLPEALRHGVLRLAAHQYRNRESEGDGPVPPVAVAALWRPWRRLRLA